MIKDIFTSLFRLPLRASRAVGVPKAIFWVYLFATALMLVNGCAEWLEENATPWFAFFNNLLLEHPCFNIATAVLLTAYAGWIIYKQDKSAVKFGTVLLLSFFGIAFWQESEQVFNIGIIGNSFCYAHLFALLIAVNLLVLLAFYIYDDCKTEKPAETSSEKLTFITDTYESELVDVKWEGFAKMVTEFINNHPSSSKVLSLGINAVWGKGKSTFMSILKSELKKSKLKVIEFNPWICKDEAQITQEFFVALSSQLKKGNSFAIAKAVTKYAKTLLQFNSNDNVGKLIDLIPFGSDATSLKEQKDIIDSKLNKLDKPIVVIIDDLDRMRCDEILAVFKLIRLTASFNNIVFISAYDRAHLSKQLGEEKLTDATSYIDKIFHVEMELPEYESETCVNFLKEKIKKLLPLPKYQELEREAFDWRNHDTIRAVLPTFRDANRFLNKFTFKLYAMKENNVFRESNMSDLFMYTLMEYRAPKLLSKIIASPDDYLMTVTQMLTDLKAYSVGTDEDKGRKELMKKLKEENEVSFKILRQMFPTHAPDHRRMCMVQEFMKYVLTRVEGNNLSAEDFVAILNQDDVRAGIDTFKGKSLDSVSFWIRQLSPYKLEPVKQKRFANALLEMLHFPNLGMGSKYIANALEECNYEFQKTGDNELVERLKQEILSTIEAGTCNRYAIAVLLKQLIDDEKDFEERQYKDPDVEQRGEFMWGEEEYKKLFCLNFEKFLQENQNIKPTDFVKRYSRVKRIIECSTFYYHDDDSYECSFGRQLLEEPLQNYWKATSPEVVKQVQDMIRPVCDEDFDQDCLDNEFGTIFGNTEGRVEFPKQEEAKND